MSRDVDHLNLTVRIADAWSWLWASPSNRWHEHYVVATDLERRVRAAAAERLLGRPRGSLGLDGGSYHPVRFTGLGRETLLDRCRRWLAGEVRAGRADAHHPGGRTTSTGLRYRPAGAPLTAAEATAAMLPEAERRRRRHIVHAARPKDGKALCGADDRVRGYYSFRRAYRPKPAADTLRVTCKKCRAALARAAGLDPSAPPEVVRDRLEEAGITA